MKDRWEIILSGVGGQGLILGGSILGEAATVYGDAKATLTSSYGVETRGTFTKSDIIISKREIYFPEVMKADVVLALAQAAYDRYAGKLDPDCLLVFDSGTVTAAQNVQASQYGHPFNRLALELGNPAIANIIAIGTIVGLTQAVAREAFYQALEARFSEKPKAAELNRRAFDKGLELAGKKE